MFDEHKMEFHKLENIVSLLFFNLKYFFSSHKPLNQYKEFQIDLFLIIKFTYEEQFG
jgi:hypothetical protein